MSSARPSTSDGAVASVGWPSRIQLEMTNKPPREIAKYIAMIIVVVLWIPAVLLSSVLWWSGVAE